MQRGTAPVALHDITHAVLTDAGGVRPRPLADSSEAMRTTPVVMVLHDSANPRQIELLPSSWILSPHVAANSDPEKLTSDGSEHVPLGPEQRAALVLHVHLPKGVRLVYEAEEQREQARILAELLALANTEEPLSVPCTHTEPGNPELEALETIDPSIWAVDHERLMASLHTLNTRPSIYQLKEGE